MLLKPRPMTRTKHRCITFLLVINLVKHENAVSYLFRVNVNLMNFNLIINLA